MFIFRNLIIFSLLIVSLDAALHVFPINFTYFQLYIVYVQNVSWDQCGQQLFKVGDENYRIGLFVLVFCVGC